VIPGLWCTEAELVRAEELIGPGTEFFLTAPAKRSARVAPLREAVTPPELLWDGGLPGDAGSPADAARWAATCALFARWGLYAEEGKHHDAFWRFALAACERPVDEAMFREHFGLSYAEARNEWVRSCRSPSANARYERINPLAPPRNHPPSRPAKPRSRGCAAIGSVARRWLLASPVPDIAAKYSAKASRTLRTAHLHDASDTRLTEVLALLEFEQGENATALRFLEESTAAGQGRPRSSVHPRPSSPAESQCAPRRQSTRPRGCPCRAAALGAGAAAGARDGGHVCVGGGVVLRRAPDLPAEEMLRHLQEGQRRFPRLTRLTLASFRTCLENAVNATRRSAMLERAIPFTTDAAMRTGLEKTATALLCRQAKPRS
jgi:hypothetical protein